MSDKPKIFLTRPIPPASMELLKQEAELTYNPDDRVLSRKELIAGMAGQDALLCTLMDGIDGELLDTNPNLKIVANYAVGYNNIDVAAASARNIPVTNTPGVLTASTADMAWALMFAIGRRVVEGDQLVRSRKWQGWGPMQLLGQDITGATLGLIGFGRIGKAMVKRAQGFDMKVVYWNRTRLSETEESEMGITYASREEVLAQADFVSLHVALTPDTTHLIGAAEFAAMKSTAYLINTARGPVVDEKALVAALKSGSIGGAGLDVFEREPILEPELYDLPNVVIPPHLGSATIGTRTKMGNMAAENCFAACRGDRPPNLVNPEIYDE
ncbi:MAG: D-glycerate dehydrogenase [Opitutaceae bacterium]|jgi:glyoxylate reductase|nr:D-glycerate dehydrogenase [Opitutaceae bacterium]